jgi:formiminoglutamase
MNRLNVISQQDIEQLVNRRPGETKLGETINLVRSNNLEQELLNSQAKFVLLGIPEDIGVRANYGMGGTHTLWPAAVRAILNVQDTDTLRGSRLLLLGSIRLPDVMEESREADLARLRELVAIVDELVYPLIQLIVKAGKIPIIIGGGHNNAYPILKGVSSALGKAVNCINLDAHSDYRPLEGRHSGNGFSYAKRDGYLQKYSIVGLHRNYNSQPVLDELKADDDLHYVFYEDIFIRNKTSYNKALQDAISFTTGAPTGIELDLDCIERTLTSAASPSGLTALEARQYIAATATTADIAYLHLPEGSIRMDDGREDMMTAKLVAYLVTDFIRYYSSNHR